MVLGFVIVANIFTQSILLLLFVQFFDQLWCINFINRPFLLLLFCTLLDRDIYLRTLESTQGFDRDDIWLDLSNGISAKQSAMEHALVRLRVAGILFGTVLKLTVNFHDAIQEHDIIPISSTPFLVAQSTSKAFLVKLLVVAGTYWVICMDPIFLVVWGGLILIGIGEKRLSLRWLSCLDNV